MFRLGKHKKGLVLGGGGAKGFAHIGALIALEEQGINSDIICGTSAGALAGAFYAFYGAGIKDFSDIESTKEFSILSGLKLNNMNFEENRHSLFLKTVSSVKTGFSIIKMLRDSALLSEKDVFPIFKSLFGDTDFSDLKKPLITTAFDIVSGKDVYIQSGPLWKGVLASCSIPGIFPPVQYGEMLLVDGGVTNQLPVKPAVLAGAKSLVAIDLRSPVSPFQEIKSAVNLHLRIDALLSKRFDIYNKSLADLTINPDLAGIEWHQFNKYRETMEKGKNAVTDNLAGIKRVYGNTNFLSGFFRSVLKKNHRNKLTDFREEYIFI